jgi:hypothetical protein
MDNFVTIGMDIVPRSTCVLPTTIQRRITMQLHDDDVDDFFRRNLPDDGFPVGELYDEYFGLIEKRRATMPELHGYVVTMDGTVVAPELRPRSFASLLDHHHYWRIS